jgi:hypothetical protein
MTQILQSCGAIKSPVATTAKTGGMRKRALSRMGHCAWILLRGTTSAGTRYFLPLEPFFALKFSRKIDGRESF